MGKSLPPAARLQEFSRIVSLDKFHRSKHAKPYSAARFGESSESPKPRVARVESVRLKARMEGSSERGEDSSPVPLAEVVSDCVKRWFQDTLREAKAGDSAMQVLVGQMYYSGYGVPRDAQKGRAWISKASRSRSAVWKVSDKHPGYNASDSDSDDVKDDAK